MKTIILLVLMCVPMMAQTRDGLQQKDEKPSLETYEVRPNIMVNVKYDKDGEICTMIVEPKPTASSGEETPTMKSVLLTEIIDELAPADQRGKHIISGFMNLSILSEGKMKMLMGSHADYDNVTITRWGSFDKETSASIKWVKRTCRGEASPDTAPKFELEMPDCDSQAGSKIQFESHVAPFALSFKK